jgi:hypothetical protein
MTSQDDLMVEYTFFLYDSADKSKSRVDRSASISPGNQSEKQLHQEHIVARDGIEPSTFRFLSAVGIIRSDSTLQELERSGQIPTLRRRGDVED